MTYTTQFDVGQKGFYTSALGDIVAAPVTISRIDVIATRETNAWYTGEYEKFPGKVTILQWREGSPLFVPKEKTA